MGCSSIRICKVCKIQREAVNACGVYRFPLFSGFQLSVLSGTYILMKNAVRIRGEGLRPGQHFSVFL